MIFFVSGDSEKACRESCNDFSLQGRYIYYLFRCMSKTLFGIGTPMKSESFFSDDSDEDIKPDKIEW